MDNNAKQPINRHYKPFPPGLGHIKVPLSSRGSALAATGLYAPCRPRALVMQRIVRSCIRLFGPRILPGRSVAWHPPAEAAVWSALLSQWRRAIGPFDEIAIAERAQTFRTGVALLLLKNSVPVAFVKLRRTGAEALSKENRVLQHVWAFQPRTFSIPEPYACSAIEEWAYLITAPLPSIEHNVPRRPNLGAILEEVGGALQSLPRSAAAPDHWCPMHGDFTPWNLREVATGQLVLYDWEDAGWGPPGADDVLYRASLASLRNTRPEIHQASEAVEYWYSRVSERVQSNFRERRLNEAFRKVLRQMLGESGRMADSAHSSDYIAAASA